METPQERALGAVSRSLKILKSLPLEGLTMETVPEIENLVQTTKSVEAMLTTANASAGGDLVGFASLNNGASTQTFAHQQVPGQHC